MNPFQDTYDARLRAWKMLRSRVLELPQPEICVEVDRWWQQAPLINHHLHWHDSEHWPDPWTMLSENTYCTLTRALGICYTLLMSDISEIELVQAVDLQCESHNLVLVGREKYVLNYWPNSVLSNQFSEFDITSNNKLTTIKNKINL